jgi:hypothetical protein
VLICTEMDLLQDCDTQRRMSCPLLLIRLQ